MPFLKLLYMNDMKNVNIITFLQYVRKHHKFCV